MGRGSSKAGSGGKVGSGNARGGTQGKNTVGGVATNAPLSASDGFSYSARSITRDKLFETIETINPANFATYQQPDTIRVSGVEFQRWNSRESVNRSNGNTRFVSDYQATKAAADGTYPTFQVVVERKSRKVKGATRVTYEYDKSSVGTKFN